MRRKSLRVLVVVLVGALSGCSVAMEAKRPTPVNLDRIRGGTTRGELVDRLGAPEYSDIDADGATCDHYRLYTHGYGKAVSIPISVAEGVADIATLGLAELALTPAERKTQSRKNPVIFCYRNSQLARVTEIETVASPAVAAARSAPKPALESAKTYNAHPAPAVSGHHTTQPELDTPATPRTVSKTPDQLPPSMIVQD